MTAGRSAAVVTINPACPHREDAAGCPSRPWQTAAETLRLLLTDEPHVFGISQVSARPARLHHVELGVDGNRRLWSSILDRLVPSGWRTVLGLGEMGDATRPCGALRLTQDKRRVLDVPGDAIGGLRAPDNWAAY